uniref:Uncharacterized protein n=1 Tax=Nelumbo nucifera TaxID=4432 RepID=A0A822XY26_NELNU|nr:TPA_asm: hypothetical protein HUJ06_025129 [Nelumbo nucifera]
MISVSYCSSSLFRSEPWFPHPLFTATVHLLPPDSGDGILVVLNPNLLQNWQWNQNPCSFSEITCKDSKISALDLSSILLASDFKSIASSLLSLERLESLVLKRMNITGNLSSASDSWCSEMLSELDLVENGLSSFVLDISRLSSCSSLKSMNLSRNLLGPLNGGKDKVWFQNETS